MLEKDNSNLPKINLNAYLEEMRILKNKVNSQDVQIRQLAKKIGVELPE